MKRKIVKWLLKMLYESHALRICSRKSSVKYVVYIDILFFGKVIQTIEWTVEELMRTAIANPIIVSGDTSELHI